MEKLIRNAVCVLEIMRRRGNLALLLSENGMNIEIFHHIWQKSDKKQNPENPWNCEVPWISGASSRKPEMGLEPTTYALRMRRSTD